jgi:hypothetical protein
MIIIKSENIKPFDVDETLVTTAGLNDAPGGWYADVEDPISGHIHVRINAAMVRLLKEEAARGSFVIVWSRGGYQWAANVVKALGLNKYVNLVISKPLVYFDDKDAAEWLTSGQRVFLDFNVKYKSY